MVYNVILYYVILYYVILYYVILYYSVARETEIINFETVRWLKRQRGKRET